MKTIVIGCDNAAVNMKNALMKFMQDKGYTVENVGCDSADDPTYYPYVAEKVCEKIIESNYEKEGVLNLRHRPWAWPMTANKFPGIRAGVCHDSFSGERFKAVQ